MPPLTSHSHIKRKDSTTTSKTSTTTTNNRHRSHKGCWTCKRKRIQCDEAHPACSRCTSRGVLCEGYEIRLRWGAGIASRGRFNGAEKPSEESIPPPWRKRWDLRDKSRRASGSGCGGNEMGKGDDGQGQPEPSPDSLHFLSYPAQTTLYSERQTVNILNEPVGDFSGDFLNVTKHFQLPVSTTTISQPATEQHQHQHQHQHRHHQCLEDLQPTLHVDVHALIHHSSTSLGGGSGRPGIFA
ncbi:Fungal Zn(2)-Cys(6) binuclear cluster domain-containing protein [Penicillium ucsense]|uniref:Fungal Zn(2)-Cys(6) binuclear cluster domain-containing protein n=1 Tax=Penicillium ucsense TaxID=2839758 RepID=A0A8J8WGU5_9EURO|nr:Fungal Zn(2)-Cys(6) binuclear cluster domain-containing protein [Penicillium ucsense]KAF7733312.1 Fungal Zn(2)-Cys(6) binuclear cluster domain-containing protein [Penicillium ucsense]